MKYSKTRRTRRVAFDNWLPWNGSLQLHSLVASNFNDLKNLVLIYELLPWSKFGISSLRNVDSSWRQWCLDDFEYSTANVGFWKESKTWWTSKLRWSVLGLSHYADTVGSSRFNTRCWDPEGAVRPLLQCGASTRKWTRKCRNLANISPLALIPSPLCL